MSGRQPHALMMSPPSLPGFGKLAVPLGKYGPLPAVELFPRGNKANGAMEPHPIVIVDKLVHNPFGIFQGKGCLGPQALRLEGLMSPFDLPVALRVEGACFHMAHAAYANELLEIPGNELGSIVRDDFRAHAGELLPSPLKDDFHILLSQ